MIVGIGEKEIRKKANSLIETVRKPQCKLSPSFGVCRVFEMIDKKLLSILVCPVSKGELEYKPDIQELWCRASGLAYPIRDDIPVMLESEARALTQDEIEHIPVA